MKKVETKDKTVTLKDKTARGLLWGVVNSGGTQALNLVIGIFLARLLSPGDYGIVGMLAIFTAIAGALQDSGFTVALVNEREERDEDMNAVFWFNITVSVTIYAVLFFAAPLIAAFFHQPCLIALSRFVFLSFVLASLCIPQGALLTRRLMVREKTIISLVALVVSGVVGIVMAFMGKSYWSLAVQQFVFILLVDVGRLYYCRWRPHPSFRFAPIRRMFAFSGKILVTTLVSQVSNNLLTVIFGRLYSPSSVGAFTQANKWNNMAQGVVSSTLGQVAQPVLASISEERDRERRVFRKMLRFTAFLAFPVMFGLIIIARELIVLAITSKWLVSVPLLRILAVGGSFYAFTILYQNLVISRRRSGIYMWCCIGQMVAQLLLVVAVSRHGVTVMVTAFASLNIAWLLVWQYAAHRLIGLSLREVLSDILPFMAVAVAVMALTYVVTVPITGLLPRMLLRVVIAVALYGGVMKLLRAKIMEECVAYLLKRGSGQSGK